MTIGVRGTDFIMVVYEFGGSMITLLPSCDVAGACFVGEITAQTDAGIVMMNPSIRHPPSLCNMRKSRSSVVLDISEDMINNLLILRKRTSIEDYNEEEMKQKRKLADFLGIDFLEVDFLEGDAFTESIEGIWVTALDETAFMLADMLHDMLDKLNEALGSFIPKTN